MPALLCRCPESKISNICTHQCGFFPILSRRACRFGTHNRTHPESTSGTSYALLFRCRIEICGCSGGISKRHMYGQRPMCINPRSVAFLASRANSSKALLADRNRLAEPRGIPFCAAAKAKPKLKSAWSSFVQAGMHHMSIHKSALRFTRP